MTSTVAFAAQPMGLPVSRAGAAVPALAGRLGLQQVRDHCFLCWMVAITASFLTVGVIGIYEGDGYIPLLLSGTKGDPGEGLESLQAVMVDIPSVEVSPETVEETVEEIEVPTPVEALVMPQELPEVVPALVAEDVFTIPTPPRIETALRPVEPKPEQPKPKSVAKPNVRRGPTASPARGPQGSAASAAGGGGSGGSGNTGTTLGRGQFKLPAPPYPSHLKSMGVTGSVRLMIYTNVSGRVDSVSVISSSGNSALDEYASSWARRNGRGPAGIAGKVIAPLTFRLR